MDKFDFVSYCEDICEKSEDCEKKINQEIINLRYMYSRLDAIIESSYDGIYITDGEGNTLRVNRSYEKLTGIEREKLIGKNMHDLEKEGVVSKSATLIVMEKREAVTLEQWINNKKKLLVTANPFFGDDGNIEMVVTNVRDVTDLEILKQEITKNQEIVNQIKKKFLHDEEIVFNDAKSRIVIETANRIARKSTTIMITGETGTGKEVIAKYIHNNSCRKDEAFISVNCGAIPDQLLESELFGYEKGAFTGANSNGKTGIFEIADKGTLFLDEIGELPLTMQVKLLRVLQEEEVQRIGSVKPKKIDVRIIVATNRNLKDMIEKGIFREDLYYRLNIVPIKISPLRERKEDIVPLSLNFLKKLNEKYDDNKIFSSEVLDTFVIYDWPGNVRQLKNIVERCFVMTEGNKITKDFLPIEIKGIQYHIKGSTKIRNMKKAVSELESELINKAFEEYGNVRDAAKKLGIDPSTFVRKRQKYEKLFK